MINFDGDQHNAERKVFKKSGLARIIVYLVVIIVAVFVLTTITESVRSDYIKDVEKHLPPE